MCFPHPLANLGYESQWSSQNFYSYKLLDKFMWMGLGSMINEFRKTVSVNFLSSHLLIHNVIVTFISFS